jgi:transcriptional regulator with XRE-family HTH domain
MAAKLDYQIATPDQIAADIGATLMQLRLAQNISQEELAETAGVSVRTLRRLEAGEGCALDTFIRLLQALDLAGHLRTLLPEPGIRPAERMVREAKVPQRASRKRKNKPATPWIWDEDLTP